MPTQVVNTLERGQPPPTSLTVDESLRFLKEDNEVCQRLLDAEIAAKQQVVDNVVSFIPVIAFIAGVQAQVITWTFDNNDTSLRTIAKAFGFIGLVLDCLGTSFGVVHVLALQNSIRKLNGLKASRDTKDLQNMIESLKSGKDIEKIAEALTKRLLERKAFWMIRRHSLKSHNHLDPLFPPDTQHESRLSLFLADTFRAFPEIAHDGQYTTSLGIDPMFAMGAGLPCLLVSIACFAIYSQPGHVWKSCLAFTILSAISMPFALLYDHEVGGRGMLFRHLNTDPTINVELPISQDARKELENSCQSIL